jgi:hypothetical protein
MQFFHDVGKSILIAIRINRVPSLLEKNFNKTFSGFALKHRVMKVCQTNFTSSTYSALSTNKTVLPKSKALKNTQIIPNSTEIAQQLNLQFTPHFSLYIRGV